MDAPHGHYRHNPAPAALIPWNMPGQPPPSLAAKRRLPHAAAICILALCALMPGCDSPPHAAKAPTAAPAESSPPLAAARVDLAKTRLAANAPDEALALLVSALAADPKSVEARADVGEMLSKTRWHLPETTLRHHMPVDRIEFAAPSTLWVSLNGESNTMVRWNVDSLRIENILFPIAAAETRSLVIDPTRRAMVIERAGVTELCNAQTLQPIRDLGVLPEFATPCATIVFSEDGLLLAHPAFLSETDHSLVWDLRDTTTGEIIRKSEPAGPNHPLPLAAFLDRRKLRVLHADGSLLEMPVSPVEEIAIIPPSEPVSLRHALFFGNGLDALILKDLGPHHSPEQFIMSLGDNADSSPSPALLLEHYPWSRHPGIWTGLYQAQDSTPLKVEDRMAVMRTGQSAPIRANSPITAFAVSGDEWIVGEQDGTVMFHRTLPLPLAKRAAAKHELPDAKSLAAIGYLADFMAGTVYDEAGRVFTRSGMEQRLAAFKKCDFDAVLRVFPELDFSPVVSLMKSFAQKSAPPESLDPLRDRLARAAGLKPAALAQTDWHHELTVALLAGLAKEPAIPAASPSPQEIEKTFDQGDESAIMAAIQAAGGKGPVAAKALELALASTHPEWILACLSHAADLPPLLRKLAVSRIAWLQERKADAIAGWPDVFPDLHHVRQREDWDGWEQADFSQALEKLKLCVGEELAAIEVPKDPTPEQRKAVADRLADPATLKAVGRARFAKACLKAALALSAFKEDTETTFKLASQALDLGEAPEPCLRAEAMALTALGDYQKAHERWVTLITEHPVETQEPGDYAEASYTAFENANPQQAMAILITGLHRFPNDANFALRAGWVALLTGNAERAYRFLLTGRQIGYPPEKLENATALLAIAAAQTGAAEDAAAFYQDLITLDPAWRDTGTIDSLAWPEELKASLRQLVW